MPYIAATATGFPPHYYPQDSILADLQDIWADTGINLNRVARLHANTTVEGRYIAVPKADYHTMSGWKDANATYAEVGVELGAQVLTRLFEQAGIHASEVSMLFSACTTGIAVPTIDARIMNRVPFRTDLKRVPAYGLGCAAGAAGLARVVDYLRGHPTEAAVLLCQEFCSLTIQKQDTTVANLIACGLFGDASAAVLMVGDEHPLAGKNTVAGLPTQIDLEQPEGDGAIPSAQPRPDARGPQVLATRSVFFPESERTMGWDVTDMGMRIVLSADVPDVAAEAVPPHVTGLLAEHDLTLTDVDRWLCHPGGPKVIGAIESGLGLDDAALAMSRDVLRRVGNVSSVSVLLILDRVLRQCDHGAGDTGVLLAMGPAFAADLALLRW
ncbi:MAG: 3-oxoacyl-[acyl-carrier-protein] synthase III C-terminal domain-containing protein [Bacteroidota bacterium]